MGGEGGSDAEPLPDTTPPHVVEVSPPDGATGVRADADIVVTFNEPMHRVETEKAYSSLDLPTKKVTFSWSNGDRTLTIHADDGLEYGSFSSGNATNHQQIYSYVIAEAARDVAGNRLEPEFAASFTMLREHWEMLSRVSVTRVLSPPPSTGLPECMAGEIVPIGELTPSQGKGLLVTFSTAAADWVEASSDLFRADLSVGIQPEATTLGPVHVDHVRVDPAAATWTTAVLDEPPLTHAPPTWTADTRDGLLADLTERSDGLTQFFIHHELATNTSAPVESSQVACSSITLKVSRLAL